MAVAHADSNPADAIPSAQAPRPNIVFVLVDTLRGDMLLGQRDGKAIMPELARMAAQGRVFTAAASPSSWTRPAMASLFTGQHVSVHRIFFGAAGQGGGAAFSHVLPPKWLTLAEALQGAGYGTRAFVTNPNLAPGTGLEQGFAASDYTYDASASGERVTHFAIDSLNALTPPFFLYLHYVDPHIPYYPPDSYRTEADGLEQLTAADRIALRPESQVPYLIEHVRGQLETPGQGRFEPMSEHGKRAMRMLYEGECSFVDTEIARAITALRARFPQTVFVLTSDHGEQFWEHGSMGHGLDLYEETVHVPLAIFGPGVGPGVIDEPVSTIGIYKTLLNLIGIEPEVPLAGVDLLGPGIPGRPVFSGTRGMDPADNIDLESVRSGSAKLIADGAGVEYVAFDLEKDPREQAAVEPTQPPWLELIGYLQHHRATAAVARQSAPEPITATVNAEALEQLNALGYLGGLVE